MSFLIRIFSPFSFCCSWPTGSDLLFIPRKEAPFSFRLFSRLVPKGKLLRKNYCGGFTNHVEFNSWRRWYCTTDLSEPISTVKGYLKRQNEGNTRTLFSYACGFGGSSILSEWAVGLKNRGDRKFGLLQGLLYWLSLSHRSDITYLERSIIHTAASWLQFLVVDPL